jgi:hypothetical protein
MVIYSIVLQLGAIGLVLGASKAPTIAGGLFLLTLIPMLYFSIYGTYKLAKELYDSVGMAIVMLLLSFILGFLLLLYLSAKANQRFREAGIKVGLLGVPAPEFD